MIDRMFMTKTEYIRLKVRKVLYIICNGTLSLIPKKKKLILFTAWFGEKYIDNTKYVYEYFLENSEYKPVWLTKNESIYNQLSKEGKPVEKMNSFKGIWLQIRAQAFFSTVQYTDYKTWYLSHCLYIDLGHGHPIKDPGEMSRQSYMRSVYNMITKRLYYYAIVASTKTKINYNVVDIPQNHIFVSDFARNDVFINKNLQSKKNQVVDDFKNGRRAIVYMPTHRSDGKKLMNMKEILNLPDIEKYCAKKEFVFIIKKHFYHRNERQDLEQYPHILDITNIDDIDPQVLLCQADLLITDYSACYIDYMLLKRPIIFFHYDIEEFNNVERKLYYNFKEIDIAPIVYAKSDLVGCVDYILQNGDKWQDKRMKFAQENYFDNLSQKDGCLKVKKIFDKLYVRYFE